VNLRLYRGFRCSTAPGTILWVGLVTDRIEVARDAIATSNCHPLPSPAAGEGPGMGALTETHVASMCEDMTSNMSSDPKWIQFRRLLLGTVIEALLKAGIAVDFPSIEIAFDPESEFRVPRFDNYMRFKGWLKANVTAAPSTASQANLVRILKEAWPSLLDALDLPVGDKLTSDRNEIEVVVDGQALTVRFDLEAD